jgi:predicted acylesterase/phospholipase RssA
VNIEDFAIPYAAVTTDLVTGHEIWLQKGDLVEAMRASFSLPGIFPPVKIKGAGWPTARWCVPCRSPPAARSAPIW